MTLCVVFDSIFDSTFTAATDSETQSFEWSQGVRHIVQKQASTHGSREMMRLTQPIEATFA